MKNSQKGFWTFYTIWIIVNISLLIFALNDTFGEFDKSTEKFWPITVGGARYYDFFELSVYLLIPLFIFYLIRIVHPHQISKEKKAE